MISLKYKTAGHDSSLGQLFFYCLKLKKKNLHSKNTSLKSHTIGQINCSFVIFFTVESKPEVYIITYHSQINICTVKLHTQLFDQFITSSQLRLLNRISLVQDRKLR